MKPKKYSRKSCYKVISVLALVLLIPGSYVQAAYGDLLWKSSTEGIIFGAPAVGPSGEVVVGSEDNNLYSFNPDGTVRWIFQGAADWFDSAPTIARDGTVYAGSWDNHLYAINGEIGSLKWKFETGAIIIASPAVGLDGTVYVASNDSFLYAVNPDGSQKWISEPVDSFSPINSSPVLNRGGDTLYFGNDSGKFFAVDSQSGLEKWSFDLTSIHPPDSETDYAIVGSAAIEEDGDLYFGSENGYLYALTSKGNLRWTYKAAEAIRSSPAISQDGKVYFPAQDGYLYALDSEGFQLWESFVGDVFYCSPAIDSAGNILIAAYAGSAALGAATDFLSLDSSGNIIWEYLVTNYNDSSPNIAPDGSIYFGAHDGYLYKFEGASPLMEGQWPRFQGSRPQRGLSQSVLPLDLVDVFPSILKNEADWSKIPWLGSGWLTDAGLPWILHRDHGFIYVAQATADSVTYYDPYLDQWLFASATTSSALYSYSTQGWIYHAEGTSIYGNRWFFDFDGNGWFTSGI